MSQSFPCVFCDIISGAAPRYIVYEDSRFIAFLDKYPITEGHTLVLPKQHYARFDDIPEETVREMFGMVQRIARNLKGKLNATGAHISVNDGKSANQLIPHIHVHIIPRKENDDVSFASRHRIPPEKMEEIRRLLSL